MLCRRLERELTASNTIIRQQQLLDEANLRLQERIKRLEDWKDSAMAVEREWDANAISTMLGGQLGESQRVVIMREVPRLLERIKRLEAAGDEAICPFEYAARVRIWTEAKEANL
jgi:Lon protease-like protein